MTPFAYADSPLDRSAGTRALCPGPAEARFVLLAKDRIFTAGARARRFTVAELPETAPERVLLGREADGTWLFAASARTAPEDLPDLRSLALSGHMDAGELGILAQAKSLLSWHERHRFCAQCGHGTVPVEQGGKRLCGNCQTEHFPRTDPVVILTVRHGDDLLLGRGLQFPEGHYSALAGFMEPGETIEQAGTRELQEETGIRARNLRYVASQPWPFPSSLMIGLLGEAENRDIRIDPSEIADARWFARAEVAALLNGSHERFTAPKAHAIAHHLLAVALSEM